MGLLAECRPAFPGIGTPASAPSGSAVKLQQARLFAAVAAGAIAAPSLSSHAVLTPTHGFA